MLACSLRRADGTFCMRSLACDESTCLLRRNGAIENHMNGHALDPNYQYRRDDGHSHTPPDDETLAWWHASHTVVAPSILMSNLWLGVTAMSPAAKDLGVGPERVHPCAARIGNGWCVLGEGHTGDHDGVASWGPSLPPGRGVWIKLR